MTQVVRLQFNQIFKIIANTSNIVYTYQLKLYNVSAHDKVRVRMGRE